MAKALALECMRGAHRQQRKCYLFAFSGPGEVRRPISRRQRLSGDAAVGGPTCDATCNRSMNSSSTWSPPPSRSCCNFYPLALRCIAPPGNLQPPALQLLIRSVSLQGGTDVDAPLIRSLDKLDREEWAQADILMVTDGEIRPPGEEVEG